jgi:hypothetical protein
MTCIESPKGEPGIYIYIYRKNGTTSERYVPTLIVLTVHSDDESQADALVPLLLQNALTTYLPMVSTNKLLSMTLGYENTTMTLLKHTIFIFAVHPMTFEKLAKFRVRERWRIYIYVGSSPIHSPQEAIF